jgi:prepilin-type N-terminal cleavage/methylation domain-containing protein
MQSIVSRPSQHGFTFNEILVAMAVAAIVVLGCAATTITVIRGNHMSGNFTAAVNLAQDKMELLRGQARIGNEIQCPGDSSIDAMGTVGGIFKRCWKTVDSTLAGNLKEIEVSVTWHDGEPRSVTLTTLMYQE